MILAKEIIAKARDEINELCIKDLANEIKNKDQMIRQSRIKTIETYRKSITFRSFGSVHLSNTGSIINHEQL